MKRVHETFEEIEVKRYGGIQHHDYPNPGVRKAIEEDWIINKLQTDWYWRESFKKREPERFEELTRKVKDDGKLPKDPQEIALKAWRKALFKTKKGKRRDFTEDDLNWEAIYELKFNVTQHYEKTLKP